jgi:hypothetical protein
MIRVVQMDGLDYEKCFHHFGSLFRTHTFGGFGNKTKDIPQDPQVKGIDSAGFNWPTKNRGKEVQIILEIDLILVIFGVL